MHKIPVEAQMLENLEREDVVHAVDKAVEDLLTVAKIERPPVDAIALAQKHLGIVVCLDQRQPQRGRAQKTAGQRHIYLRPEPREERHQWTVAHEIGEHLRADLLTRLGMESGDATSMTGESLANLFAHRLLVPTCWFAEDARDMDFDLLALKARYRTSSHELLAWRMLDLPDPCIITIIDNEKIHRRRSNAWPTRRRLEPAEEKCARYIRQHGRPHRVQDDGWTVQGWPVHEADWKREILRSLVEET
jgi:Zn-dependent peptidase ImmA (M78 family)